jgi:hypothetical protein
MLEEATNLGPWALRTTKVVWKGPRFDEPEVGETIYAAWLRLFGSHMPLPVFATPFHLEGSDVVIQVYPEGRVSVLDPLRGSEIRELSADMRLQVERAQRALGGCG